MVKKTLKNERHDDVHQDASGKLVEEEVKIVGKEANSILIFRQKLRT